MDMWHANKNAHRRHSYTQTNMHILGLCETAYGARSSRWMKAPACRPAAASWTAEGP